MDIGMGFIIHFIFLEIYFLIFQSFKKIYLLIPSTASEHSKPATMEPFILLSG